jgi:hypothetical protein
VEPLQEAAEAPARIPSDQSAEGEPVSEHLTKAKGALCEAKKLADGHEQMPRDVHEHYLDMLSVAGVQASIAQAEAMEALVEIFADRRLQEDHAAAAEVEAYEQAMSTQ